MYPVLFRLGQFEITSFGVLVALATLIAWQVFSREVRIAGIPGNAPDLALYAIFGGFAGAKLLWAIEHLHEQPFLDLMFSRGGLSWFGGFIGGVGTGVVLVVRSRLPLMATLSAATPALAIGHLIGRIGCFLVGDDYGRPSSLPWALAFPRGLPPVFEPVHPTQLYEAAWLAGVVWLLIRWRRRGVANTDVLGRYLVAAAGFRFLLEFIRVNPKIALGMTMAQWMSAGVVLTGLAILALSWGVGRRHHPCSLLSASAVDS
ncbi:MAG: prolipoprotein diacylglyceryl transferase family protein [Vicinamibacterales bacterium]